jgi:hypothetical protein
MEVLTVLLNIQVLCNSVSLGKQLLSFEEILIIQNRLELRNKQHGNTSPKM